MYFDSMSEYGISRGVNVKSRLGALSDWEKVLEQSPYVPVLYMNNSVEFQWANQNSHFEKCEDISTVIFLNGHPVAVWPLSVSTMNERMLLNSHGLPILPPLFVKDIGHLARKKIYKICLEMAQNLCGKINASEFLSLESFNENLAFSGWHLEAMAKGATASIDYDLYIDLSKSFEEIKGGFRKSYKSLISSGQKDWTIGVLDVGDAYIWNEFKVLHCSVAGRQTRSNATWAIHFDDIQNKKGFLIYLKDPANLMVGGGFFNFSRDEGFYAVGAYRRELFDKPLGHIVQYQAILELKKRGMRWHRLGVRPFLGSIPKPSDKEISIGEFKQGFASHVFPRYLLRHAIISN
jgi:FemAB family protein